MNEKRCVGNRRSEEELEKIKIELNKTSFKLEDQKNFNGTFKQLEMMQNFERAYIDGAPLISDEEWEILKFRFNYSESLTSVSPSGRTWVKLLAPLPSLDKACNMEEFNTFLNKFPDDQVFICEPKLDGLSANVRYKLSKTENYKNNNVILRQNCGESDDDFRERCKEHKIK